MDETSRPTRRTVLRPGVASVVGAVGYTSVAAALEHTLRVEAVGESARYDVTVSGDLAAGPDFDTDGTDSIAGSSASGTIAGTSGDDFTFSGEITDFGYEGPLRVFVNGEAVDPDALGSDDDGSGGSGSDGLANELVVSDPDGSQPNEYRFTVSGEVEALDDPRGDDADGDSGSGTVYGGHDGYRFSGDVTSFTADGVVEVTVNGERVDPDSFGGGSDDGGGGEIDSGGGGDGERELIVADSDGSQPNDYEFSVTGTVEALDDPRGDRASGDRASGTVYGGRDGYRYTGEVASFTADGDVEVTIDGEQIDPDSFGGDSGDGGDGSDGGGADGTRTLTFEGSPGGGYDFAVSGTLDKSTAMGASINSGDRISGSNATGGVGGGRDSYTYSGEITAFEVDSGVTVYLDGNEVDPDSLGDRSDGSGGDDGTSTLRIDAVGESASYDFSVGGDLAAGPDFDSGTDSISGSSGAGTIGGRGSDDFVFSGGITRFSYKGPLRVFVNGNEVDPDTLGDGSGSGGGGGSNEIVISDPDGAQPNDYEFTVSGTVEALDDPRGDRADGDRASGTVYGGRDGYRFSGEITSFSYEGAIEATIDGERVDPDSLGDGDGNKGGGDGKARVILSFDDGVPSAESVAKPIMDRYGYPGVIGIVTGRTEQSGDDPENLTVEELRGMQADGWEVASHTIDHTKLTSVSRSEVRRQCRRSRKFIAENGLLPPDPTLIYPYGGVNDRVVDIAEEYFEYGFGGGDDDPTDGVQDPLDIDRARGHDSRDARGQIDRAIENGAVGVSVLMFHRIGSFSNSKPNDTSRREFVDLMEYIDARSDEIEVVTSSDL